MCRKVVWQGLMAVTCKEFIYRNYGTSCFHPGLDGILLSKTVGGGLFFYDEHCIVAKKKITELLSYVLLFLFFAHNSLKMRLITAQMSQFINELDLEVGMSKTS